MWPRDWRTRTFKSVTWPMKLGQGRVKTMSRPFQSHAKVMSPWPKMEEQDSDVALACRINSHVPGLTAHIEVYTCHKCSGRLFSYFLLLYNLWQSMSDIISLVVYLVSALSHVEAAILNMSNHFKCTVLGALGQCVGGLPLDGIGFLACLEKWYCCLVSVFYENRLICCSVWL